MKHKLEILSNQEFGQIRMVEVDEKIYFLALDVARSLGYKKERNAIKKYCQHVLKRSIGVQAKTKKNGTYTIQISEMSIIPEDDVYRLIAHSKLPVEEKYERWLLFDQIQPVIRKTVDYIENEDLFIETFFSDADCSTKELFRDLLLLMRQGNITIEKQRQELMHLDEVINDLAEKAIFCQKIKSNNGGIK